MADSPKYPTDPPNTLHLRAGKNDHKGTTAAGLYFLAEDFLRAAKLTAEDRRTLTGGPSRLLALHACELFLKAYLLHAAATFRPSQLRTHNFAKLYKLATAADLRVTKSSADGLLRATELAEHNRARYVVVQRRGELPAKRAIAIATELHGKVAKVLGMQTLA